MNGGPSASRISPGTAPLFAALGDPCRLSIVEWLCERGPLPTIMLADAGKGVSRQGLTKHLRVLEGVGLVDSFRVGRDRHWQVRHDRITTLRACLERLTAEWDTRLEQLKSFVEGGGR
jgi:DNA-binding transcriptional ArsR family regulator